MASASQGEGGDIAPLQNSLRIPDGLVQQRAGVLWPGGQLLQTSQGLAHPVPQAAHGAGKDMLREATALPHLDELTRQFGDHAAQASVHRGPRLVIAGVERPGLRTPLAVIDVHRIEQRLPPCLGKLQFLQDAPLLMPQMVLKGAPLGIAPPLLPQGRNPRGMDELLPRDGCRQRGRGARLQPRAHHHQAPAIP